MTETFSEQDYAADLRRNRVWTPLESRFLRHLILGAGDHWLWGGHRDPVTGYGKIGAGGKRGGSLYAHRVAYTLYIGPIPDRFQVDHLCRIRACVRPSHLEAVTQRENIQRAAALIVACPQGHVYDQENTRRRPDGSRYCRECNRARARLRHG